MSVTVEILMQRIETLEKRIDSLEHLVSGNDKKAKKAKKAAKAAASTDDDEPKKKRPQSGYQLFGASVRAEVIKTLTKEYDRAPKQPEIMKHTASMWKDADKDQWNAKSKEIKETAA